MRPMMSPRPGSAVGSGTTELAKTRRHAALSPHSARSHSAARSPVSGAAGVVVGRCRRRRHRGDGGHRRLPQRAHLRQRRAAPHAPALARGGRASTPGAYSPGRWEGARTGPVRSTGGRWSGGSLACLCARLRRAGGGRGARNGPPARRSLRRCGVERPPQGVERPPAAARGAPPRAAAPMGRGDQCLCGCTSCAWSCAAAARDCRGRRAFSATPTVHGACLPAERGLLRHPVALRWDDVQEGRRRALCWRACRGV